VHLEGRYSDLTTQMNMSGLAWNFEQRQKDQVVTTYAELGVQRETSNLRHVI
jgi:hypothetical protein